MCFFRTHLAKSSQAYSRRTTSAGAVEISIAIRSYAIIFRIPSYLPHGSQIIRQLPQCLSRAAVCFEGVITVAITRDLSVRTTERRATACEGPSRCVSQNVIRMTAWCTP